MVSRIFFSLEVGDRRVDGPYVDVKLAVGAGSETGPIEVGSPRGASYRGPFNHDAFRDAVERYYRGLVGSQGTGIRIQGGRNIRMRKNRFVKSMTIEFQVTGTDASW